MADIKKTICDSAWNYPVVNFFNNEVSMCCHARHQKVTEKDVDKFGKDLFTKFDPLMKAKMDLLNGVQTPNCSYCWESENKNLESVRHSYNQTKKYFYEENVTLDYLSEDQKEKIANISTPRLIEISLGNTCDLKCMYCNAIFSSQWAVEDLKFNDVSKDYYNNANNSIVTEKMEKAWWEWFDTGIYNDAISIGLIGGEPLIIDKTYEYIQKILERCKNRKNSWPVTISIVTNLNANETYFNKLLQIIPDIINNPNVMLDLSVSGESLGERAEFIRTGLKWNRFEKNVNSILQIASQNKNKIHFSFMIAVNALCVSTFPQFIQWAADLQEKYQCPINLRGSQVVYPIWLRPSILSDDYIGHLEQAKQIVEQNKLLDKNYMYGKWTDYSIQIDNVIKAIMHPDKDLQGRKIFVEKLDLLCKRRNLDFKKTFPEMIEFYERCSSNV